MSEKKVIRVDEAQVLLLDELVKGIRGLSQKTEETIQLAKQQIGMLEKQQPEGIVDPMEVTVTTVQRVLKPPSGKIWFSVSIVSDGPDEVSVVVNTEKSSTNPYPLRKGESCEVDFGSPKIKDLLLQCNTGTATLRIRGVR